MVNPRRLFKSWQQNQNLLEKVRFYAEFIFTICVEPIDQKKSHKRLVTYRGRV